MKELPEIADFSFSGCSWFLAYELGVGAILQDKLDMSRYSFSGASSGSIVATSLAAGIDSSRVFKILLKMARLCKKRRSFSCD